MHEEILFHDLALSLIIIHTEPAMAIDVTQGVGRAPLSVIFTLPYEQDAVDSLQEDPKVRVGNLALAMQQVECELKLVVNPGL